MAFAPGTQLGPYRITEQIGAGGMGEVYRAEDTRLERIVAIKVLPEELANDRHRRKRFEREARAVSRLNHPHICTLYDVGEQDQTYFLVMEMIEGETLEARLAEGPLPLEKALQYAIQIAEALKKAHQQQIVHRDLKPGNVMLTPAGVKLLDFGLAKLGGEAAAVSVLSQTPTREGTQALTREGAMVGTLPYMAPEQIEGEEATARTDIFSFGLIVYEMVTGKRAFAGKSRAGVISAILASGPSAVSTYQPLAPPLLDHLVRVCLEKDPNRRWQALDDVVRQLEWIAEQGAETAESPASRIARKRLWQGFAVTAVLLLSVWFASDKLFRTPAPVQQPSLRYVETVSDDRQLGAVAAADSITANMVPSLALSPDGQRLVYVARDRSGEAHLFLREFDQFEARTVPGTEGAYGPFFSPDGQWIGFFQNGALRRVARDGETPVTIVKVAGGGFGASWRWDNTIVYSPGVASGLLQVPASGGRAEPLTVPDIPAGEIGHNAPHALPNGKGVVFDLQTGDEIQLAVLSLETGRRRSLVRGVGAHYLPTGHLIYMLEGNIWAVPFDSETLKLKGEPRPVIGGVRTLPGDRGDLAVSDNGMLVYLGASPDPVSSIVWVTRDGTRTPMNLEPDRYTSPRLSPDGSRITLRHLSDVSPFSFISVTDLSSKRTTRLTVEGAVNNAATWSSDGRWVAFNSTRNPSGIYSKRVDGNEPARLLIPRVSGARLPSDWSPNGRELLFVELNFETKEDIWVLTGEGEGVPLIKTPFRETAPVFSPDGNWLAYVSDESGRQEIYLQPYPSLDRRSVVSAGGGSQVRWSPDGRELFFVDPANRLMAVAVEEGRPTGPASLLFETSLPPTMFGWRNYDVAPDGGRFVTVKSEGASDMQRLYVVVNWFDELLRTVPVE